MTTTLLKRFTDLKKFYLTAYLLLCIVDLFAQNKSMSDNLPGKYLRSATSDTSVLAYRVASGYFGDFDIILDAFNLLDENYWAKSWYIGTTGRDFHADILISDNNYFLTGYSNLLTGFSDDIIVSRVSYNETESWVKILRGNVGDKGSRISVENDNIVVLANSNSYTTSQSFILLLLNKQGDLLIQAGYDFDKSFFPTDIQFDNDFYYVSGYLSEGTSTDGIIFKINKSDFSVNWAKKFENIHSSEIQQLFIDNESLYFSGWSGDGSFKALFAGEIKKDGELVWKIAASHRGLITTTDLLKKNDSLIVSGFIRTLDGNEEDEFVSVIDILSKNVEINKITEVERTFGSGDIILSNDTIFLSSFQILNNLSHRGLNSFWEFNNGGCFQNHTVDSVINQEYLEIKNISVIDFIPSFTEITTGGVKVQSAPFSEIIDCEPNSSLNIYSYRETQCDNFSIYRENNSYRVKSCPNISIEFINIYSILGKNIFGSFNSTDIIPAHLFENNRIYFVEIVYKAENSVLCKKVLKWANI